MSSIAEHLASIERSLATAKAENAKLEKGCKASAAKLRNALLEIGKTCSDSRRDALEAGKAIVVKKRLPKPESKDASSGEEQPDVPVLERQDAVADLAAPAKKVRAARKPKVAPAAPPALEEAK